MVLTMAHPANSYSTSFEQAFKTATESNGTQGDMPTPYGDTWRGIGSDWFNANNIAKEDFYRQLQSADWLRSTQVQRSVADMKAAGINPIMAVSNGMHGAGGSSGSAGTGNDHGGAGAMLSGVIQILAGLISRNAAVTAAGVTRVSKSFAETSSISQSTNYNYNYGGRR